MLTKSNYLLGLQCPKLLWVTKNSKGRLPELGESTKATLEEGKIIGELATTLYPDGIDLSSEEFYPNITKTKELLEKKIPLFEAGFLTEDLYSRCDILEPTGDSKWNIIEVKSATEIKDINIHDVSFQKYVYEKSGIKIKNCYIMHINNQYVREGEIEPSELFHKEDITERVEEYSLGIEERIINMIKIINTKEPIQKIGVHCSTPYDCPLTKECWQVVPENSIFDFNGIRKKKAFELYDSGIKLMKDVPDSVKLNDKQKIQRLVAETGNIHKDEMQIKYFLENLTHPIYYLDFETIAPAIPKFDKSKPYQQIPFQYSLHVQNESPEELKHISFLAEGISDPRPAFLQSLKENLDEEGDILVYNQSFEISRLKECIQAFPEYTEWLENNILPRIKDLADIFKKFWYYDQKQKGSASIKAVLQLFSELKHSDLEIKKGDIASLEFSRVTYGNVSDEERKKVREALEKYCELDTFAEFEIIKGLKKIFETQTF